jgi:hypothetical protein
VICALEPNGKNGKNGDRKNGEKRGQAILSPFSERKYAATTLQ